MAMKNGIRKLRDLLILNQQEFADLFPVCAETISRWERGVQEPKPKQLRRMEELKNG